MWRDGARAFSSPPVRFAYEWGTRPTCEVILTESPEELRKEMDPEAGIALIKV